MNLDNESAAVAWAQSCAQALPRAGYISLRGPLGAGKSFFARHVIQALGHTGAVPSPTYTLIEEYPTPAGRCWHLDLYRLGDAEELEFLNVRDAIDGNDLVLIEWAERGLGWLPAPTLVLDFDYAGDGRVCRPSRTDWLSNGS
ncbi:tRNA (adenosine(37)-N6)-threonylcarbamoyltransferase complex ATPase subunit type 1 TsaE [Litorivicinus lipolyticus]|uniref:tRNA threonylcarbamoyladenosine biosynthesis protein TsaE n=1 Tax=Litorivicinus lipolyticus TaxID=418701 RepID=A0A5Q2QBI0_9GAMM|nr:tRNA (adenosine(37)-N6)-threonylcarbamoyltransferase complex ATPase subunit type 1 TsaE [Litorivicinus lipolyticus]QGG79366.1 tRNA (adenosine(37)-N6)-threonylcarbamoyltransferase complex ATPase subunit type 1 TsaE [Litorivicinus lipolyticus]